MRMRMLKGRRTAVVRARRREHECSAESFFNLAWSPHLYRAVCFSAPKTNIMHNRRRCFAAKRSVRRSRLPAEALTQCAQRAEHCWLQLACLPSTVCLPLPAPLCGVVVRAAYDRCQQLASQR